MKEGESDQQSSEEVVGGVSKQRVWDDVNRRDLVTNKTGLKWGHLKHMHINKEVSMEEHYVQRLPYLFPYLWETSMPGASLMCQYTNGSEDWTSLGSLSTMSRVLVPPRELLLLLECC